eukprot:11865974-Ditylum_brightwellii.AAC.1
MTYVAADQQQYKQAEGITDQTNTAAAVCHTTFSNAVEEIDEFEFVQDSASNNDNNLNIIIYSVCLATNKTIDFVVKDRVLITIIDSGAIVHMFNTNTVFVNLLVMEQTSIVLLRDGLISLPVKGIGTTAIYVNNKPIILPNSLYVTDLEVSLYSILEHARHKGNTFSSDFSEQHILSWPNTSAIANTTEPLFSPQ